MKARTIAGLAFMIALLGRAETAAAGQTTGTVQAITVVEYTGPTRVVLIIQIAAAGAVVVTPPGCAPSGLEYTYDLNTVRGRAALQVMQSAVVTGLQVRIGGTGTCTLAGGTEDGNLFNLFAP